MPFWTTKFLFADPTSALQFLENEFQKHKYTLIEKEKEDLRKRLISKPIQLYLLGIEFLKKHKEIINYENVKNLIILDIRIRDNIKKVITALEESIWVKYNDSKIQYSEFEKFKSISENISLHNIIKKLKQEDLNIIRKIRNNVSHIVYPILFDKFQMIICKIKKLKEIDFVDKKIIDDLFNEIHTSNKKLNLKIFDKLFKEYYKL